MRTFDHLKPIVPDSIPVRSLINKNLDPIGLIHINPDTGLDNAITDPHLHRPQLALAGFVELFTFHRVQVFGNTEMQYLRTLDTTEREQAFMRMSDFAMPVIILTNNHTLDTTMIDYATTRGIAVFQTAEETTMVMHYLSEFLANQFAPQVTVHASFVDVYGVGIMFLGRSGIGKSEIALDLVERGHRLVADDIVILTRKREDIIIGTGTNIAQHFMEIRGLGLIDVRHMFGVRAIRYQKRLEIIVEVEEWDSTQEYTRTGLDMEFATILGVEIMFVRLPIFPGKNVTVIAEVIALHYLSRMYGYDASQTFAQRLDAEIKRKSQQPPGTQHLRNLPMFGNDTE
jgi:HPr kinase/phosphorylase